MSIEIDSITLRDSGPVPRTTSSALSSLLARLNTLHVISGTHALGSLVAGLASLGREASATAEGALVREALLSTRIGSNGEALWSVLGMDDASSIFPPSPVLDDLRNDLSLLVAHDLDAALVDIDLIEPAESLGPLREPSRVECIDLVVGMWAYSTEITGIINEVVAATAVDRVRAPDPSDLSGPVLR